MIDESQTDLEQAKIATIFMIDELPEPSTDGLAADGKEPIVEESYS